MGVGEGVGEREGKRETCEKYTHALLLGFDACFSNALAFSFA